MAEGEPSLAPIFRIHRLDGDEPAGGEETQSERTGRKNEVLPTIRFQTPQRIGEPDTGHHFQAGGMPGLGFTTDSIEPRRRTWGTIKPSSHHRPTGTVRIPMKTPAIINDCRGLCNGDKVLFTCQSSSGSPYRSSARSRRIRRHLALAPPEWPQRSQ